MKVYIGPPKKWWGPYQIANLLQCVGFSEDRCDKIGEWLDKSSFGNFCERIHKKFREQKKVIKIHYYDTWSVDSTLAPIILLLLKQLRDTQHGAPFTEDIDVPPEFCSGCDPDDECTADDKHHERWDWIFAEMIWAFEQLNDPNHDDQFYTGRDELADIDNFEKHYSNLKVDMAGLTAHEERIRRGTMLFGKYFQALWD